MRSYLYIEQLFQNILKASKAIEGRLLFAPYLGNELNTDNMNEVLERTIGKDANAKQYPLAIMMPPSLISNSVDNPIEIYGPEDTPAIRGTDSEKRIYNIDIAFLTSTFYQGDGDAANEPKNTIKDINPDTITSKHRVVHDWYDMDIVARDFVRAFKGFIEWKGIQNIVSIYESDSEALPERISPITTIGQDRVSGVYLQLRVMLYENCDINDYTADGFAAIELPDVNHSH